MNWIAVKNDKASFQHYGILGMKWGVRRTPEQLGHKTSSSDTNRSRNVNAAQSKSTAKYVKTSTLTGKNGTKYNLSKSSSNGLNSSYKVSVNVSGGSFSGSFAGSGMTEEEFKEKIEKMIANGEIDKVLKFTGMDINGNTKMSAVESLSSLVDSGKIMVQNAINSIKGLFSGTDFSDLETQKGTPYNVAKNNQTIKESRSISKKVGNIIDSISKGTQDAAGKISNVRKSSQKDSGVPYNVAKNDKTIKDASSVDKKIYNTVSSIVDSGKKTLSSILNVKKNDTTSSMTLEEYNKSRKKK